MTELDYLDIAKRKRKIKEGENRFTFKRTRGAATVDFLPGSVAKLHFGSRDTDTCSFGDVPAGFFLIGDKVSVFYGQTKVFVGELQKRTEVRGRGDYQREDVVFAGPWDAMQRLVYRQYWKVLEGGREEWQLSSKLILNQHQSGTPQTLDSELKEILNHGATSCGYTVANDSVSVSSKYLPFDECRDITVADAINRELRFFPKTTVRFDYSGEKPTIYMVRGNDGAADASYVAGVAKTDRTFEYNAHPITGVDLEIETVGEGYRSLIHDRAGNTTSGNPDCLYATVQLQGASGSTVTQELEVETEDLGSFRDATWWIQKHPRLATYTASEVTIKGAKRSGASDAKDYPRIARNSAGELKSAKIKCRVETFSCTATVKTGDDEEEDISLTMQFLMTNAESKKYRWVVSSESTAGETVPEGLARAILNDRSGMLMNERMAIRLGDALPVLGDRCDGLYLQSFDIDCETLTAELNFGQPEHLSVEDMASLLSGFRTKSRPSTSYSRYTGKPEDDKKDTVEIGGIPPLQSSEWSPGTKKKTTIKSSAGEKGEIVLDSDVVEKDKKVEVHKLIIKGKGNPTSTRAAGSASDSNDLEVQILATEDIEIDPEGDDVQCVKKDKAPADNLFESGKGVAFGTSENNFSLSAAASGELELGHTSGKVLGIPKDVDAAIAILRRLLTVKDSDSPQKGSVSLGYGEMIVDGIAKVPVIKLRYGGSDVASFALQANTNILYINNTGYGITLNGKKDAIKCQPTPSAKLEDTKDNTNIANLNWISQQLKSVKIGDEEVAKVVATKEIEIPGPADTSNFVDHTKASTETSNAFASGKGVSFASGDGVMHIEGDNRSPRLSISDALSGSKSTIFRVGKNSNVPSGIASLSNYYVKFYTNVIPLAWRYLIGDTDEAGHGVLDRSLLELIKFKGHVPRFIGKDESNGDRLFYVGLSTSSDNLLLYSDKGDVWIGSTDSQHFAKLNKDPSETLGNASGKLNIPSTGWINSQLKTLKINGEDTGIKVVATGDIDIVSGGAVVTEDQQVVTDVQFNPSTFKCQKKTRTVKVVKTANAESGWTDVFETVQHEHN